MPAATESGHIAAPLHLLQHMHGSCSGLMHTQHQLPACSSRHTAAACCCVWLQDDALTSTPVTSCRRRGALWRRRGGALWPGAGALHPLHLPHPPLRRPAGPPAAAGRRGRQYSRCSVIRVDGVKKLKLHRCSQHCSIDRYKVLLWRAGNERHCSGCGGDSRCMISICGAAAGLGRVLHCSKPHVPALLPACAPSVLHPLPDCSIMNIEPWPLQA